MTDHKPGASLNLDLVDHQAPGEWTEHEIDGFIASRYKQRVTSEGECPEEPPWDGTRLLRGGRREGLRRRAEGRPRTGQ